MKKLIDLTIGVFTIICATVFVSPIQAQQLQYSETFVLPIALDTPFYLTGTPHTHYPEGTRAAIDFQITDELGFIDKGASLYAPFDGYAEIITSENGSLSLEIINSNGEWKVVMAHVMDDSKKAQALTNTFPKYVIKNELVAYQGDSGYINEGRFPVHVHYEVFMGVQGSNLKSAKFTNANDLIDMCSELYLSTYCNYVDETGYVVLVDSF